MKKELFDFSRQ